MKSFLFLLLLSLPLSSGAFVVIKDDVSRSNLEILVQSYDNKADITISQTLKNESDTAQTFDLILPTRQAPQSPTVFWRSEGRTLQSLSIDESAPQVFNAASTYNQPGWLGAMDNAFDAWWRADDLVLAPNQTGVLKIQYQTTLDFFDDMYLGTLWLADGKPSERVTVNMVRAGSPLVWEASLGDWVGEKTNEAWARQWTAEKYTFTDNLVFWASDVNNSTLAYNFLDKAYQAQFKAIEAQEPDRVVLLLDTSGSVFGVRFERLKQAFRNQLEALPDNIEFKVGLVDSELEWIQTDWTLNTRNNQRDVLTFIEGAQAQGATDWEAVISAVNLEVNSTLEAYPLVWFGDFSDLPANLRYRLANAGWKMLMIDFWQSDSAFLESWWERYDGQYVPLFNTGFELVEADTLQVAWRQVLKFWPADQTIESPAEDWFEPIVLNRLHNNKALGQTSRLDETSTLASFLPRWWAQYKLADYLRQHEGLPLNSAQIQAVLSIAHAFGLNVFEHNGKSTFEALEETLETVSTDDLWREILRLHETPVEVGVKTWQSKPFYLVNDRWEPFDWNGYSARSDRPEIRLWSEAHRNLFTEFPQMLARPMSFGPQTAFCAGQRCASIGLEGRAEAELTDTILWASNPTDHWALDFWADLVWAGVLAEDSYDQAQWAEPISRGQFLVWLQQYLEPQAILPAVETTRFRDLEAEQLGASQALWFAEQGLFNGYSDGTARLDQPLLRIEGLKLLMTAYGLGIRDVIGNADPEMPFTDLVGWTQPWGYEAYLRGLVSGYEDNTFRPFQPLTEAESFKLIVEAKRILAD